MLLCAALPRQLHTSFEYYISRLFFVVHESDLTKGRSYARPFIIIIIIIVVGSERR